METGLSLDLSETPKTGFVRQGPFIFRQISLIKQCKPRSGCSFRSSLIKAYTTCPLYSSSKSKISLLCSLKGKQNETMNKHDNSGLYLFESYFPLVILNAILCPLHYLKTMEDIFVETACTVVKRDE